jgi:hypothetical protein
MRLIIWEVPELEGRRPPHRHSGGAFARRRAMRIKYNRLLESVMSMISNAHVRGAYFVTTYKSDKQEEAGEIDLSTMSGPHVRRLRGTRVFTSCRSKHWEDRGRCSAVLRGGRELRRGLPASLLRSL